MQVMQGTNHPEAGPWHKCTQKFIVVIGYQRNHQVRVIKLIRGSKVLNTKKGFLARFLKSLQAFMSPTRYYNIFTNKKDEFKIYFVLIIMLLDIRQIYQHQIKMPCQIYKVATGTHHPHHNTYCNILTNKRVYMKK